MASLCQKAEVYRIWNIILVMFSGVKMHANTECHVKLYSISSCPLLTDFQRLSPKSMYIGTTIPILSAHAVKPQWRESTKPSVIVAVNGLIGRNIMMQKWYIRAGVVFPRPNVVGWKIQMEKQHAYFPLGEGVLLPVTFLPTAFVGLP